MLLLLAVLLLSVEAQIKCSHDSPDATNGKVYKYDLSHYSFPATDISKFIQGTEPAASSKFAINLCADASQAFGCKEAGGTPVCQKDDGGAANSCGELSTWSLADYEDPSTMQKNPAGGVIATVTSGTACAERARQTILYLKCNPQISDPLPVVQITEQQQCIYTGTIESRCFCPGAPCGGGAGGFDAGWVFVIIVLIVVALIVIVSLVRKFGMHKEGTDAILFGEFFASLPGLVKDGVAFFAAKITGPCRGGSYSEV